VCRIIVGDMAAGAAYGMGWDGMGWDGKMHYLAAGPGLSFLLCYFLLNALFVSLTLPHILLPFFNFRFLFSNILSSWLQAST